MAILFEMRFLSRTSRWVHRVARSTARLRTPRNLWIGAVLAVLIGLIGSVVIAPRLDHSDEELRSDIVQLVTSPPQITEPQVAISAGANPLPDAGFPHGRGFTHADFPNGYRYEGESRPTFNSYRDAEIGEFADRRYFLRACILSAEAGCLVREDKAIVEVLDVAPGEMLIISMVVENNGDPRGNASGEGPAVARNTRVLFSFPTRKRATTLHISAYIYARNAVVDEARPSLRTISDNLQLRSLTGKPIELEYIPDKARVLQVYPDQLDTFTAWELSGQQQRWLFTGDRTNRLGNTEADPDLGLPIGSEGVHSSRTVVGITQEDELSFRAGPRHHLYVQFQARVRGPW